MEVTAPGQQLHNSWSFRRFLGVSLFWALSNTPACLSGILLGKRSSSGCWTGGCWTKCLMQWLFGLLYRAALG